MNSRIRFTDALNVFASFPPLERMAPKPSSGVEPLSYARELLGSSQPSQGLAFIAHLLPRREAVWWGCQCVGVVLGPSGSDEGMRLAIQWVRDPDEPARREALTFVQASDLRAPTHLLARAAAYSGGSLLAPDQAAMAPLPEACAQSINAALVLACAVQAPAMILPWMRAVGEAGIRFAEGDDAKVLPPKPSQAQASPQ